jgi:hypothetical protein
LSALSSNVYLIRWIFVSFWFHMLRSLQIPGEIRRPMRNHSILSNFHGFGEAIYGQKDGGG